MNKEEIKKEILNKIDIKNRPSPEEIENVILKTLREKQNEEYFSLDEYFNLAHEIYNSFTKLDMLQDLIDNKNITEIMINGPNDVFVEENGRIRKSMTCISSKEKLEDIIQQMVSEVNRSVNVSSPIADARLMDGSRINIVLPPVGANGPIVTIRKFPEKRIKMDDLLRLDSLTKEASDFLELIVKARYNIFVSGGTGSGKTTFLNVLSDFIPKDERIIVIEDNLELQITEIPNIVRLEARNANTQGEGEISLRDLIKSSLRMRPDRIIVGEVRGNEAVDMLQAMNTGHDGSLSTGHANSPRDMLARLETMVLMGLNIPLNAIRRQIASGIDILVHLGRLRDKSRRVLEIDEVIGIENDEIKLNKIFEFQEDMTNGEERETDNKTKVVCGELKKVGEIQHKQKLENAGLC